MQKYSLVTVILLIAYSIFYTFKPDISLATNGEIINLYIRPLAIEVKHIKQNTNTNSHKLYLLYEESKSFKKENIQYESKMRIGIYRSVLDKSSFDDESRNIYAQLLEDIITHQGDTIYSVMIDLTRNAITSITIIK